MQIGAVGSSRIPLEMARRQYSAQQPDGFTSALSSALGQVSQMQNRADDLASKLVLGQDVDVHDAVIATEEASLAFQYTLQVRNKLIEAYQEIMRMQM